MKYLVRWTSPQVQKLMCLITPHTPEFGSSMYPEEGILFTARSDEEVAKFPSLAFAEAAIARTTEFYRVRWCSLTVPENMSAISEEDYEQQILAKEKQRKDRRATSKAH